MSQELHYTSVARGLKAGTRGFGTVAVTANLPETLAERLEGLSAYRAVYPPGDSSAPLNPVAYVHIRLALGNHLLDALSRIGPAGLDYSGRPNKYAHHIVLEPHERPEGGPAWLLSQPGFIQTAWQGEPRILPSGPPVPRGDRPATIARSWMELTGDAGWAGVLAESFLADPRRPVFLIYRPGVELLPLFAEAIALLPASRRWDVEFSTYLTNLPPGVSCTWRGVLEGSAEARNARRLPNALILDLVRPPGRAQGGALVHLARTGERLDTPAAASSAPSGHRPEPGRSAPMTAGPPPRLQTSAPAESRDENDWLPDLAARLGADESLLGGERLTHPRPRPRTFVAALAIAGCLVPLLAATLYWSPSFRRQVGLEHASSPPSAAPSVRPNSTVHVAGRTEAPRPSAVPAPPIEKKPEPPPPAPPRADIPAARVAAPALILAFAPPEVPRSTLGATARQSREIRLPQDVADRVAIRNGPEFRLTPLSASPHSWEIATRTGSGLGGGFPLARLSRVDARSWQFDWTKNAKAQSTQVEGLKDTILQLDAIDGRVIYVLLRGLDLRVDRPIEVWKNQRILFDRLEPRIRSVEWAANPDVLEGTRWKPRIRAWKVVISRPGDDQAPLRTFESGPAGVTKDAGASPPLERDLIPGEVKLKLAIDPSTPRAIEVRIEPNPDAVQAGRERRKTRRDELRKDTPKDKDGGERDPLDSRRAALRKLQDDGVASAERKKSLEREIAALEAINEIGGTEDLLTHPAHVAMSVVIGLDVEGPGVLDIVRIGDFAGDR